MPTTATFPLGESTDCRQLIHVMPVIIRHKPTAAKTALTCRRVRARTQFLNRSTAFAGLGRTDGVTDQRDDRARFAMAKTQR